MADKEFELPSGAKLRLGPAAFGDAKLLHDVVLKAAGGKSLSEIDLETVLRSDVQMGGALMDIVMKVMSDSAVEAALFKCADRGLYSPDGVEASRKKVDRSLFDDTKFGEQAREDYYFIALRTLEVNVGPFFKKVFSALLARAAKTASTPPLRSEPVKTS